MPGSGPGPGNVATSSGHRVCSACAAAETCALSSPLTRPTSTCLSCLRALYRPYKFELDGQARCGSCHSALPSSGQLFEDMVARLVLVWVDARRLRWPAMFMTAMILFLRLIGRLLVRACVSFIHKRGMSAAAVLRPVAPHRVAPVLTAVILRWLHGNGKCVLLTTDFAAVDACPLPAPAPLSLARPGFLVDSAPLL